LYLQRVELHGFKSFVNKVSIKLDRGITVIVGPNGSGKSNVVDALRWVLGETSVKSLRGSRLEDIIFSGTKNKRPMGMAEVTIVLDNSSGIYPMEYNEITVTRKVFRDGESQFLINKNSCRLKDVQALFMDTGLGKNAFAIIGQGKVDDIINSSPEERRPLLEEVAGITKYKYRKKEAEQKVAVTEQSLLRIDDIVYEIEEQLPSLKTESDKAKEYLSKIKLLENIEFQFFNFEREKLQRRLSTLTAQYYQNNKQVITYSRFLNELDKYIFDEKFILDKCKDKISTFANLIGEMNSELERYLGEEKVLKEQVKGLMREIEVLKADKGVHSSEVNNWTSKVKVLYEDIKNVDSKLKKLEEKVSVISNEISDYENNLGHNEGQITEANNLLVDYQSMLVQYKNDIAKFETKISFLQKQSEKIEGQLEDKVTKLKGLSHEQQKTVIELKDSQTEHDKSLEAVQANKKKADEIQIEKAKVNMEIDSAQKDLYRTNSRLNFLKDLEEDMEGYFPGVKAILLAKKNNPGNWDGIVGSVAELIVVPPELVVPIETAIGSQLQNLISISQKEAEQAISFLKANKSGKVTFLPLNTIQTKTFSIPQKHRNSPGLIGLGSDLIKCDNRYSAVIKYLLGRVLIVENLNIGLDFAKEFNYSVKIVSLDGQVIMPGGSITGGFIKTSTNNLLSRKNEIASLIKTIAPLENSLKIKQDESNRLRGLEEKLALKAKDLIEISTDLKNVLLQKNNTLSSIKEKIEITKDEISIFKSEINVIKSSKIDNDEMIKKAEKKVLDIEKQISDVTLEVTNKKQISRSIRDQINKLVNLQHQEQIEKSVWDQKRNQLEEKVEDFTARISNYKEKIDINQKKLLTNTEQIQTIENSIKHYNVKITKILLEKEKVDNMKNQLIESKEFILNTFNKHEKLHSKINNIYQELTKKQHQLELERTRIETNLETIASKIDEKFGEDFVSVEVEIKQFKPEIERLKEELSALGQVNTGAIEHYEKLSERTLFLQDQKADLLRAKQSLEKVIKEIDSIIEERFSQTFAKVSHEFSSIFKYLFGGGSASIYVTNEEDLLNTGVDIEAQPPGKKLQNISLLSGGEKALTAIALLFAFLKIKPSPFCVLDEIESSLDEANEQRFSKFLRELSNSTQFLVVSHRQNTMLVADNLYGITTEEPGVSKVVSVKLSDNLAVV